MVSFLYTMVTNKIDKSIVVVQKTTLNFVYLNSIAVTLIPQLAFQLAKNTGMNTLHTTKI